MAELKVYVVVYSVPYEGCDSPYVELIFLSEEQANLKCDELNAAETSGYGEYEVFPHVVIQ